MLNQVHVEGYVTKKQWVYGGDQFFRLAVYRDPDRPRKEADRKSPRERDRPDYVTVKLPATLLAGMPIKFESGQRVQVHGWLESRQYEQTLVEFLESVQQGELEVDPKQAEKIVAYRSSTWVVAERILALSRGDD